MFTLKSKFFMFVLVFASIVTLDATTRRRQQPTLPFDDNAGMPRRHRHTTPAATEEQPEHRTGYAEAPAAVQQNIAPAQAKANWWSSCRRVCSCPCSRKNKAN